MTDDELPPLPKPKYVDFIQPKPLDFQQVSYPGSAEINSQEKQAISKSETSHPVESINTQSPSTAMPGYQDRERHQPEQGKSRLGRDIQTGRHVDVPQFARRQ